METKANIPATENQAEICIEDQLMDLMLKDGYEPTETLIADGKLHRIHNKYDKPKKKDLWYVLHSNGAGKYGHWASMPEGKKFKLKPDSSLTPAELLQKKEDYKKALATDALKLEQLREECRKKAAKLLEEASDPSPDNTYLVKKNVKAHGIKEYKGSLVIPVHNEGVLVGLQFIPPDGEKKFLKGTQMSGSYFCMYGDGNSNTIHIVEGYATGATIHETTGCSVVVAFDCGNLEAVAKTVRAVHPDCDLIICADDDRYRPDNPGLTKAKAAALATGAKLAVPTFPVGDKGTDFNDMAATCGTGGAK